MATLEQQALSRISNNVHKLKSYISSLVHMCSNSKQQEQLIADSISVAPSFSKASNSILIDVDLHIRKGNTLSIRRKLSYDIPLSETACPEFTGSETWSAALPNDATATEFDKDLQLACDSVFAQIGLFHFEQFYYDLYPLIANVCKDN